MNLRQELHNIFKERLPTTRPDMAGSHINRLHPVDQQQGTPVETLLSELKQMPNGSRAELVREVFASMPKDEQTRTLVTLADAVNK